MYLVKRWDDDERKGEPPLGKMIYRLLVFAELSFARNKRPEMRRFLPSLSLSLSLSRSLCCTDFSCGTKETAFSLPCHAMSFYCSSLCHLVPSYYSLGIPVSSFRSFVCSCVSSNGKMMAAAEKEGGGGFSGCDTKKDSLFRLRSLFKIRWNILDMKRGYLSTLYE